MPNPTFDGYSQQACNRVLTLLPWSWWAIKTSVLRLTSPDYPCFFYVSSIAMSSKCTSVRLEVQKLIVPGSSARTNPFHVRCFVGSLKACLRMKSISINVIAARWRCWATIWRHWLPPLCCSMTCSFGIERFSSRSADNPLPKRESSGCIARWHCVAMQQTCLTTAGGRPKPRRCFLSGRLRWTLLPKDCYGHSLSCHGSNTQPFNWKAGTLPLGYRRPQLHCKALVLLSFSHECDKYERLQFR